jgi:putative transposase
VKFAFIDEHLQAYPIETVCRVLAVSRSGYYAWRDRPMSDRQARADQLEAKICAVHEQTRCVYGSPRLCKALQSQGEAVCENTVAKVMRRCGIRARSKKTFVPRTTDSTHDRPVAANLLDRQFEASLPDQKWAADLTYVRTGEGWLYLAAVMDLCSRKIVGWSMSDHLKADLVSNALHMALQRRRPEAGLLHHSDRGVQYACEDYQHLLTQNGLVCSMSRKGNCWDNAMMESFFATLKSELVNHQQYATHEQARASIFEYVEVFYNRQRLHSALGYQSPEAFEAALN